MKDGSGNRLAPENEAEIGRGAPQSTDAGRNGSASEPMTKIALAHGVGVDAVEAAFEALRHGGGTMAQFSHPDFGGMAQWSAGGMSMVGDMFNAATKARLDGVLRDLADALRRGDLRLEEPNAGRFGNASRFGDWPEDFGPAAAAGSQNDMRYAFFPSARRLVIDDGGTRTIYDTGEHVIAGVSQQQSSGRTLAFQSQLGAVTISDLPVVG